MDGSAHPTAPALSPELLEQLAVHTKANSKMPKEQAETSPVADKPTESVESDDPLADEKTDAAVDEILQTESDEVLAAEDAAREPLPPAPQRRGFWRSIGHFFAAWWRNKWARNSTIFVLVLAVGLVAAIPNTRYYLLNKAGVRSSMSLTVVDNGTRLPLKNVTVRIAGHSAKTNSDGLARVENIPLGKQQLTISRIAFADITENVVIGWGSNPLGNYILDPTGARYQIKVTDYVSGKPIEGAEAVSDDESVTAVSDNKGIITLTFGKLDEGTVPIMLRSKDYRDSSLVLDLNKTDQVTAAMVPSQKAVFVSKQSGKYDLVSMYVDGKDRKTLLAGTGNESNNVGLVVSPDNSLAAMVSTRDNVRSSDGFLLSTLMVVDTERSLPATVTHAEQVQLIAWDGNKILFVETSAGASKANPNRFRLISYDYATGKRAILATANQFNGIASMGGFIYYAVAGTDPDVQPKMYRVKLDGTGRQTVLDQEVWTVVRAAYDTLHLQTPEGWYSFKTDGVLQKTDTPAQYASRRYVTGPKNMSAWVDNRDGQGALLLYNPTTNKDTTVRSQDGLNYPVRWLNDTTLLYRVVTNQETADYAIGSNGGTPKKISDVTNTFGFAQ